MKYPFILTLTSVALLSMQAGVAAQDRIFRCGNEYTNNAKEAEVRGCKAVEGGNVTVVQGTRVNAVPPAAPAVRVASNSGRNSETDEQRARDQDSRTILEGELKKAESRLADLQREYNNGEPERRGDERNFQKYQDRVAELKANIQRTESDIAGIRRELQRLPSSGAK